MKFTIYISFFLYVLYVFHSFFKEPVFANEQTRCLPSRSFGPFLLHHQYNSTSDSDMANPAEPKIAKEVAAAIYKDTLTSNQFRLLQLSPGSDKDLIECKLEVVEFNEGKPQYEALSYKWGEPRGHGVKCNDDKMLLPVNVNLYFALQRFRLPDQPRLLWVDDICINQDDEEERGRQVQIFHRIYAEAKNVLIWLGAESEDSDVAMEFFPRMMNHLADKRSKMEVTDPDLPSGRNAAYKTPKMIALNNLLSRPWFMRVWTLQEGAFASRAVVVCGGKELPFDLFEEFNGKCQEDQTGVWTATLSSISSAKPADPKNPPRFVTSHIHGISKLKQVRSGRGPRESVPMLLYRLRSCEATDARDRVYSMWSFLPDNYLQILEKPRYERDFTAADLFYQVARIELVHNRNLDFLGHAGIWQQRPGTALPSWAADWSYRQLTHPLCVLDHDCLLKTDTRLYRASGDLNGSANVSEAPVMLEVRGKVLGEVTKLTNPFTFTTNQDKDEGAEVSTSEGGKEHDDDLKAKVAQSKRQLEYAIRMFNETTSQIALCLTTAAQCHSYPQSLDAKTAAMHTLTASLTHHVSGPALGATLIRVSDQEVQDLFAALDAAVSAMESLNLSGVDQKALKLLGLVREVTRTRRFFVTDDGYMGLAPGEAGEGDRVTIVYGCSTPVLLRGVTGLGARWRLVGECYVYGLMDGEAVGMDDIPVRDICLV